MVLFFKLLDTVICLFLDDFSGFVFESFIKMNQRIIESNIWRVIKSFKMFILKLNI